MPIDRQLLRTATIAAIAAIIAAMIAVFVAYRLNAATTVLIVRHAEKEGPPADPADPPISTAGQARAQELARVVGQAGIAAVFATQFQRTQQTVQPLATAQGLSVTRVTATDTAALLDQIRTNHFGETVLVAGHSNTVDDIIEGLGGAAMDDLPDGQFDNLFVVVIRRMSPTKVVHLKYGVATP